MIRHLVVLGAGSAGLLAALALRKRLPHLPVQIIRSADIGVIGVGEGTTHTFPNFLVGEMGLNADQVLAELEPIWKLGIRFLWGPRERFFYTFSRQFNHRWPDLPRNNGYYCDAEVENVDLWSALMAHGKAFARQPSGLPRFEGHRHVGFHIENKKLVAYLERRCAEAGATFVDGTVQSAERGARGIEALVLESGERLTADLFVDASGFRSELLGRVLEEPFLSYDNALFCDRAVIGGWARTSEPLLPFTTAETMDAGWCWQIEHEHWINRGYVYSSRFLSDDAAREEFLRKNPQVTTEPRVVRFRAGRRERMWVGNVVGIGNASGFVEPLEATSLATIINQCNALTAVLIDSFGEPSPGMVALFNRHVGAGWDEIRDFIALHYRFNTRLDTAFWRHCRAETPLGEAAELTEFFQENGPTTLHEVNLLRSGNAFGIEGYLAMLIGQRVPYRHVQEPTAAEWETWRRHCRENAAAAQAGFSARETLELLRRNAPPGSGAGAPR